MKFVEYCFLLRALFSPLPECKVGRKKVPLYENHKMVAEFTREGGEG